MLAWWTRGNNRSYTATLTQRTVPGSQTPSFLLGLADPMHSADGLQLMGRVEDRLHQQHMSRFDDVQTVGAGVQREEEDVDLFIVFEGAQVFLENFKSTHSERSEESPSGRHEMFIDRKVTFFFHFYFQFIHQYVCKDI